MAEFEVLVKSIIVRNHPNADKLDIATIDAYEAIVGKNDFTNGDLVAYIPEQAIVPNELIEEMGLTGRLAGKAKNRVKAIRLRGIYSEGLCYPARDGWVEGQDVTEELGIIKYEAPIPTSMSGDIYNAGFDRCIRYDIENIKKYPRVIEYQEPVVFTEKIHGTWCQIGVLPSDKPDKTAEWVVSSKGLAARGLAFKLDSENNKTNLYVRAAQPILLKLSTLVEQLIQTTSTFYADQSMFILGEVFGQGVQDLHYGANAGSDDTLGFRVFDVYKGVPGRGRYLNDLELEGFCNALGLTRVPVLYRGPFTPQAVAVHTSGLETISGEESHMREGIVIRPIAERRSDELGGRVILKSVSEDYKLRKGGTEHN